MVVVDILIHSDEFVHVGIMMKQEDVFSCYNRMQQLDKEKMQSPECIISPNLLPVQLKGADIGSSSVTSGISTTRKRLKFSDYDHNNDIPDEKRSR